MLKRYAYIFLDRLRTVMITTGIQRPFTNNWIFRHRPRVTTAAPGVLKNGLTYFVLKKLGRIMASRFPQCLTLTWWASVKGR